MTVNPIIIDNAIPPTLQEEVKEQLKFNAMWYYCPSASGARSEVDPTNTKIEDSPQMVHGLINENESAGPLGTTAQLICNHIERQLGVDVKNIIRAKANLLMKDAGAKNKHHPPHMDVPNSDCLSIVYYVEDSDGETLIFDKTVEESPTDLTVVEAVQPKQGRIVAFPSKVFHASQKPAHNDTRTIINFIVQTDRAKIVDMFGI